MAHGHFPTGGYGYPNPYLAGGVPPAYAGYAAPAAPELPPRHGHTSALHSAAHRVAEAVGHLLPHRSTPPCSSGHTTPVMMGALCYTPSASPCCAGPAYLSPDGRYLPSPSPRHLFQQVPLPTPPCTPKSAGEAHSGRPTPHRFDYPGSHPPTPKHSSPAPAAAYPMASPRGAQAGRGTPFSGSPAGAAPPPKRYGPQPPRAPAERRSPERIPLDPPLPPAYIQPVASTDAAGLAAAQISFAAAPPPPPAHESAFSPTTRTGGVFPIRRPPPVQTRCSPPPREGMDLPIAYPAPGPIPGLTTPPSFIPSFPRVASGDLAELAGAGGAGPVFFHNPSRRPPSCPTVVNPSPSPSHSTQWGGGWSSPSSFPPPVGYPSAVAESPTPLPGVGRVLTGSPAPLASGAITARRPNTPYHGGSPSARGVRFGVAVCDRAVGRDTPATPLGGPPVSIMRRREALSASPGLPTPPTEAIYGDTPLPPRHSPDQSSRKDSSPSKDSSSSGGEPSPILLSRDAIIPDTGEVARGDAIEGDVTQL